MDGAFSQTKLGKPLKAAEILALTLTYTVSVLEHPSLLLAL
jgi:hypothetical protein